MDYPVATERLGWICTRPARAATEWQSDKQRMDAQGRPLFQVELLALDGQNTDTLRVRVPHDPQVSAGQPVQVSGLVMGHFRREGQDRLSWSAERVDPLPAQGSGQQSSRSSGQGQQ